jgi:PhzF family phenazine biosynthesis protein
MRIEVNILEVFAEKVGGGNPAGVVLGAEKLSNIEMQEIAKKVGLSETAFVMKSERADFKVQFFTPNNEVDLCGHATIGTFSLLYEIGKIGVGVYTQETKAGILEVEVKEDGKVYMEQLNPKFYEIIGKEEVAKSLGIDVKDIAEELPVEIVSTGLKDILIPIKKLNILNEIKPDFKKIKEISEKYDVVGYHVFSLSNDKKSIGYCRNFAPLYEIDEESATGTSNGALASYLYKYDKLKALKNLKFNQGYSMEKPSNIYVDLEVTEDKIISVKVGGTALKIKIIDVDI